MSAPAPAIAIIPARLGSTRFPEKVLACATGWPLVRHVVERARLAGRISRVVVASDDARVRDAVEAFGAACVMTSPSHPNGTSRLGEACDHLGVSDETVVVNVQGDEPELDPALIDAAVEALERSPWAEVSTIAAPFVAGEDPANPNIVKVVRRLDGAALYFSRALVPHRRDASGPSAAPLRHIGLYAYRRRFLRAYAALAPSPLEQTEQLEQLRVLEHGYSIAVALAPASWAPGPGIDTPEQYAAFVARWTSSAGRA